MKRNQTFHETLIPLLVEGVGARSYLELGTHANETIGKVRCESRYGVDLNPTPLDGVTFFAMTTADFIKDHLASIAPIDFVFIDADHAAEAAAQDFFGVLLHVASDGLICLHDTNPETAEDTTPGLCSDAWKFAQHVTEGGWEAITLPYHPGLTLIRKRVTWGPR